MVNVNNMNVYMTILVIKLCILIQFLISRARQLAMSTVNTVIHRGVWTMTQRRHAEMVHSLREEHVQVVAEAAAAHAADVVSFTTEFEGDQEVR